MQPQNRPKLRLFCKPLNRIFMMVKLRFAYRYIQLNFQYPLYEVTFQNNSKSEK